MLALARQWFLAAVVVALAALPAAAQQTEKVEIFIANNRSEAITMRFDYAFRQYTWNLIQANVAAGDDAAAATCHVTIFSAVYTVQTRRERRERMGRTSFAAAVP